MLLISLLLHIVRISAHSWIACSDYSLNADTNIYDETACLGFARGYQQFLSPSFGVDRGFNYDTSMNSSPCKVQYDDSSYTYKYHTAVYRPSSTIRLIWPAKNHVADTCTNAHIPDTQLKLYYHCDGPNKYTTLNDFIRASTEVIDWKKQGNKKGFQNCANFCSNPDKAVCHQDFVMPILPENKICTFLWFWEFNPGSNPYTSCWDIFTNPNTIITSSSPQLPSVCADLYSQCGGKHWKGSTCCKTGICSSKNEWYSQCIPATKTLVPPTPQPTERCENKLWGQCGGNDFAGKRCCPVNSQCVLFNDYFHQCVPKCIEQK